MSSIILLSVLCGKGIEWDGWSEDILLFPSLAHGFWKVFEPVNLFHELWRVEGVQNPQQAEKCDWKYLFSSSSESWFRTNEVGSTSRRSINFMYIYNNKSMSLNRRIGCMGAFWFVVPDTWNSFCHMQVCILPNIQLSHFQCSWDMAEIRLNSSCSCTDNCFFFSCVTYSKTQGGFLSFQQGPVFWWAVLLFSASVSPAVKLV